MNASRIVAGLLAGVVSAGLAPTGSALVLSGAELLTNPNVVFPNGLPTQSGNAIIFENGGSFFKLLEYRLNSDGSIANTGTVTIAGTWNLTRLSCHIDPLCLGNELDWDPHLLLTDNDTMLGLELNDNDNGTLFATRMTDMTPIAPVGANKVRDQTFGVNFGYPAIGESVEIPFVFTLTDTTTRVDTTFMGVDRSYTWNIHLGRDPGDLAIVLVQDNDEGERYQVNSLTVPGNDATLSVPEPATLALLGVGLAGLGFSRRKQ